MEIGKPSSMDRQDLERRLDLYKKRKEKKNTNIYIYIGILSHKVLKLYDL